MADRPILFRSEMVRALLDGRKTQTRRPAWRDSSLDNGMPVRVPSAANRIEAGDRLWVREAWRTESRAYDDLPPSDMDADYPVIYEADADWSKNLSVGRLRQSMHLPRWASRVTLTVRAVRMERLQEITEADAAAEGMFHFAPMKEWDNKSLGWTYKNGAPATHLCDTARDAYGLLYCLIHGEGAWDANPEVVVVTFAVHKANIDALSPDPAPSSTEKGQAG